jgi:SHAQKYF class myb-like DNA-binding protein
MSRLRGDPDAARCAKCKCFVNGTVESIEAHLENCDSSNSSCSSSEDEGERREIAPPAGVAGDDSGAVVGKWTHEEHVAFEQGLADVGRDWKSIQKMVPTRSLTQIRTHAQKYFKKQERRRRSAGLPTLEPRRPALKVAKPAESRPAAANTSAAKSAPSSRAGPDAAANVGKWEDHEHRLFEDGLRRYGRNWKGIQKMIPTRTLTQIRTHAQKYFRKNKDLDVLGLPNEDQQGSGVVVAEGQSEVCKIRARTDRITGEHVRISSTDRATPSQQTKRFCPGQEATTDQPSLSSDVQFNFLDAELCLPVSYPMQSGVVMHGQTSTFKFLDVDPEPESDDLEKITGDLDEIFASVLTATAELQLPGPESCAGGSSGGGMKNSQSFDQLDQLYSPREAAEACWSSHSRHDRNRSSFNSIDRDLNHELMATTA